MIPRPESAHWVAAAVALLIGLLLLAEAIVGTEVFRRRPWRAYLFPGVVLVSSVLLWVITVFSTFSTMHLLAHAVWAQAALLAGAVQLAVVRGKLVSPTWSLVPALALLVSGAAFLVHEQNDLFYSRSAFLHHAIGWMLVVASLFPLGQALRPRRIVWQAGFALTFVLLAVLLFADRDAAPIFGRYGIGSGP
jgi:ATP/ADP translocase